MVTPQIIRLFCSQTNLALESPSQNTPKIKNQVFFLKMSKGAGVHSCLNIKVP